MEQFDYIIIGAGSAGCVLANRLTADGRFSVCVLEAGPSDWDPFIHIPAGFMKTLVNPKINWLYEATPRSDPSCTESAAKKVKATRWPNPVPGGKGSGTTCIQLSWARVLAGILIFTRA